MNYRIVQTFVSRYCKISDPSQTHPLLQHIPIPFQAGTSKNRAVFAVKYMETIFLNLSTGFQAKKVIAEARAATAAIGRDQKNLKFFLYIVRYPLSEE